MAAFQIRAAQERDLGAIANLMRLGFTPTQSSAEVEHSWFRGSVELPGRSLFVVEADGALLGTYSQRPLEVMLQGVAIAGVGLGGVAVAPQARGQGVAAAMLRHALIQQQDLPLALLYPFSQGFYRRWGWAWVGQSVQYCVSPQQLPRLKADEGVDPGYLRPLGQEDLPQIQSLYHQLATRHGWLVRQGWQWSDWRSNSVETYGWWGPTLQAYLKFRFLSQRKIVVEEWGADSGLAYRQLLHFLAGLGDQVHQLVWNTYPTDPFPHLLQEPRLIEPSPLPQFGWSHPYGVVHSGLMWRLVNLPQAFALRRLQPGPDFALHLEVDDPLQGVQVWTLVRQGENLGMQPAPTASRSSGRAVDSITHWLQLSLGQLTSLYAGVRSSVQMVELAEVHYQGDPAILTSLDQALVAPAPFSWDFF